VLLLSRSTAPPHAVSEAERPAAVSGTGSSPPEQHFRAPASPATNGRARTAASGLRDVDAWPKAVEGPNNGHVRPDGARRERPALVSVGEVAQPGGAGVEMHPDAEARWSGVAVWWWWWWLQPLRQLLFQIGDALLGVLLVHQQMVPPVSRWCSQTRPAECRHG
jgi:hypothetical protein